MSMNLILEMVSEEELQEEEGERDIIPMAAYDMFPGMSALTGENENSLSLEKAWHGLHYLLGGEPWGGDGHRAFLLCSGTPQGEDMGFGPVRVIDRKEVQEISAELQTITNEELWSRFDGNLMEEMGIYPGVWDEPEEDLRDEYVSYFEDLKELVARAAKEGNALRVIML